MKTKQTTAYAKMLLVRYLDEAGSPVGGGMCFTASERARAISYAQHMANTTGVRYQIETQGGDLIRIVHPVRPSGQRTQEAKTATAYAECKRLGMTHEHGL